jgi:hypothetical protein
VVEFRRKRYWQIQVVRREVLAKNECFPDGISVIGQIVKEPPHTDEGGTAGSAGERWMVFSQTSKPAKNVRIALQLAGGVNLWIVSVEVSQEAIGLRPVVFNGSRLQGSSQDLQLFVKDSVELTKWHSDHRSSGSRGRFRFCTAR